MNPGIYHGISFEEYRAIDAVNISLLKVMRRSPLHYRHAATTKADPTDPMRLGTAAHCAVLEPDEFEGRFAVWGRKSEKTGNLCPRSGKYWDAFVDESGGLEIISEDHRDAAVGIADIVRANSTAMRYLQTGAPEVTMIWDVMGVRCKGRADWITGDFLVGLKTTQDIRPFVFGARCARLGYHLQWAFYHDGAEILTGSRKKLREIVIESAAPHDIAVYRITDDVIEQGRDDYRALLEQLIECRHGNDWPGTAPDGEIDVTLPSWAFPALDDISDLGLEA